MADDARISTALPRHPKTVKLHRRLGAEGCWHLVCLFLWVSDNHPDGNLNGMSDEDIEIAAGWNGQQGQFSKSLSELHFLDGAENSRAVHDWAEHNAWAANRPQRIAAARAAAGKRWQRKQNADGMRVACHSHETAMPTSPHLTSPPKGTRPEKLVLIPPDFGLTDELLAWGREQGYTRSQLQQHIGNFKEAAKAKAYRNADWPAAFRKAVIQNWANLPAPVRSSGPSAIERAKAQLEAQ